MRKSRVLLTAVTAVALILVPGGAALADTGSSSSNAVPGKTVTVTQPMKFKGYNSAVAQAHGYKIVTAPDGTQSSVPVSPAAKKQASLVSPMGTVPGDCGTSTITAAKLANDTLAYHTGYSVPFPVVDRNWRVNAQAITGWNGQQSWSDPTGPSWYTDGTMWIVGPGAIVVPITAFVVAADGTTCYSGGPTASFG